MQLHFSKPPNRDGLSDRIRRKGKAIAKWIPTPMNISVLTRVLGTPQRRHVPRLEQAAAAGHPEASPCRHLRSPVPEFHYCLDESRSDAHHIS